MIRARSLQGMAVLLVAGLILSLVGCSSGSKISKANYDKVSIGMTEAEVESILGKGEEKLSYGGGTAPGFGVNMPGIPNVGITIPNTKIKEWKEGSKSISVTFMDGKVMGKEPRGL